MGRARGLRLAIRARLAWWRQPLGAKAKACLIGLGGLMAGAVLQRAYGWGALVVVGEQVVFGLLLLSARGQLAWWLGGVGGWLFLAGVGYATFRDGAGDWATLGLAFGLPTAWVAIGRMRRWHLCLGWATGMVGLALACLDIREAQDIAGPALLAMGLAGILALGRAQALRGGARAWRPGIWVLVAWLAIGAGVGCGMHLVSRSEHSGYRIGDSVSLAQSDPSSNSSRPMFAVTQLQTFGVHGPLLLDADDARNLLAGAYWRGGVFYTLDGDSWYRPYAPADTFMRAGSAYPRWISQQHGRLLYRVTPLGEMAGRVWLEHPVAIDTFIAAMRTDAPAIQGSGEYTGDGMWLGDPVFGEAWPGWRQRGGYLGATAFNAPYPGPGFVPPGLPPAPPPSSAPPPVQVAGPAELPPFIRYGLGRDAIADNPQTARVARRLAGGLDATADPVGFLHKWLAWLNAHTVYDTERSAYGERAHVSDLFLRGGHGTCVDFATSTVVALRAVGVPARYVTGFYGGQWNPWMRAWVVGGRDAHAWVEYFDARSGMWMRADPTAAIQRVVRGVDHPHGWLVWLHAQLYGWRMEANRGSTAAGNKPTPPSAPLPPLPWRGLATLAAALGMLASACLLVWRAARRQQMLPLGIAACVTLVGWRARLHGGVWARQPWESLPEWTRRLDALSPLPGKAAAVTDSWLYGRARWAGLATWMRAALSRWRRGEGA